MLGVVIRYADREMAARAVNQMPSIELRRSKIKLEYAIPALFHTMSLDWLFEITSS